MRKTACIIALLLLAATRYTGAQPLVRDSAFVYAKNTTAAYRQEFYTALLKWSIWNNLSKPLDDDGEFNWISSFWPMELILYKNDSIKALINEAFRHIDERSADFQRALLEYLYTLYPGTYADKIMALLQRTGNPKIFAMCAEYLWQGGREPEKAAAITRILRQKIPPDSVLSNPLLMMLNRRLNEKNIPSLPPLAAILSEQFAPGQTVLYSFQRRNRDYPGLVIVRRPDGSFVKNTDGSIFHVAQLARSISNLPAYLTNGNTPQGIYRMMGFDRSRSQFIGPTENIQLRLPFEAPVDSFFVQPPNSTDTVWTESRYASLLPQSWKNYVPVYDAYWAGKAGRTAIIAHGTTIDPAYYRNEVYYPQTPSLGCLCASEIWSDDGRRIRSDQQQLVDAVHAAGDGYGYCVVIELGSENASVQLSEINAFLQEAEKEISARLKPAE